MDENRKGGLRCCLCSGLAVGLAVATPNSGRFKLGWIKMCKSLDMDKRKLVFRFLLLVDCFVSSLLFFVSINCSHSAGRLTRQRKAQACAQAPPKVIPITLTWATLGTACTRHLLREKYLGHYNAHSICQPNPRTKDTPLPLCRLLAIFRL